MTLTPRGKLTVVLSVLALLIAVPVVAGYAYLRSVGVMGESRPGKTVQITIAEGAGTGSIGRLLEERGVIESAFGFRIAAYLEGGIEELQAGRYEIATGLTARDALTALLENPPVLEFVDVTFPEGLWLTDFARILEDKSELSGDEFLDALSTGRVRSKLLPEGVSTQEGLLFPSTYQVDEKDDEVSVARRLVKEVEDRVAALDWSEAEAMGYSVYEAIIVASMIEAEAKIDSERPMVARVIYNRLEAGEPLGIDATINYAIKDHTLDLTESQLAVDSPYNTRLHAGLPPTPIGAPGVEALEAAAHPADGAWRYYVLADCEGRHAFSSSYEEFLANKAEYQRLDCS